MTALALALALGLPGALASEPTVEELLDATDDVARGESSFARVTMEVKTKRYERTMKMEAWSKGTEQSLIRILEPAKDAGVATLKIGDNIWNYLPKVDRTIKVPGSMMGGSWMGSHFTNDDLVKENRLSEQFTHTLAGRPADNAEGVYEIDLVPKPDAPVVWGRVAVRVFPDRIPLDIRYYDEKGALVRTLAFEDVREMDGRRMPARMSVIPADKPGEHTRVIYEEIDFDIDVDAATFSLQSLRR